MRVQKEKEMRTMSECEKMNCGYYYKKEGEDYPRCHYPDDGTLAPCEYEDDWDDYEPDDIDYDCGYDPYMGCFTDDC